MFTQNLDLTFPEAWGANESLSEPFRFRGKTRNSNVAALQELGPLSAASPSAEARVFLCKHLQVISSLFSLPVWVKAEGTICGNAFY